MTDEWDLGELLAERKRPETSVTIYVNEAASYLKVQLAKAHAKAKGDDVARLDEELDKVEAELKGSKYVIHLTGVPSKTRESINAKSLAKYPVKADIMGRDDHGNSQLRLKYENDMLWEASITSVENPHGQTKESWSMPEVMKLAESLPTAAQQAVDTAIKNLAVESEQWTVEAQNPDF